MANKKPTAIDFFSGVGGMSLGFKQAGFRVIASYDVERRNVEYYRKNFPSTPAYCEDLSSLNGAQVLSSTGLTVGDVDLVFGGPPCQGFSLGGHRRLDDKRNLLIYDFARLVKEIKPKYFVMENVQGLMLGHAREVVRSFIYRMRRAGYKVLDDIQVLNAADYGVPQRRKRTFILGCRTDCSLPQYPLPLTLKDELGREYRPTVADAILDLPEIELYDDLLDTEKFTGRLGRPSHYAKVLRGEAVDEGVVSSVGPKYLPEYLSGCFRTKHTDKVVERFENTLPGTAEPISRYFRLHLDGVAPTIRAGTNVDHGSHTSPRPIHPVKPRCITVREAARLHSYPDWYSFFPTRWHAFMQIGNSVPPRLARVVGDQVRLALAA